MVEILKTILGESTELNTTPRILRGVCFALLYSHAARRELRAFVTSFTVPGKSRVTQDALFNRSERPEQCAYGVGALDPMMRVTGTRWMLCLGAVRREMLAIV